MREEARAEAGEPVTPPAATAAHVSGIAPVRFSRPLGRGRSAGSPWRIPPSGWKDVLLRVKREVVADKLTLLAAGVTHYTVLGLFPAMIALVSVYALVADPTQVVTQLSELLAPLPGSARQLIIEQLASLASSSEGTLSLGLLGSLCVALWGASTAVSVLLDGINLAYDEPEGRGFVRGRLVALAFVGGGVLFATVLITATSGIAYVSDAYVMPAALRLALTVLRWFVLAGAALMGLAACYRYGPSRARARLSWLSPGTLIAALLWLGATALFGFYVQSFGSYNETYGALAGAVVLMLWLYISNLVVLLGAELNAEIEAQTAVDTTTGVPKPMGQRGAVKADVLGRSSAAPR